MMSRIQIYLADDERKALQQLAIDEMRGLRDQIRFVLRQDLERRGLLVYQACEQVPLADNSQRLNHDKR